MGAAPALPCVGPSRAGEGSGPLTPRQPARLGTVATPEAMGVTVVHEHASFDEFLEKINECASDRQALVDLDAVIQGAWELTPDQEDELHARIAGLVELPDPRMRPLPTGLEPCPYCGGVRDREPGRAWSLCLCGGIACRWCRAGRVHRPISDHYELSDHKFWHTPYFGAWIGCRWCNRLSDRLAPEQVGWPARAEDPRVAPILEAVRAAAEALASPTLALNDDYPPYELIAFHGDIELWHSMRLGAPPDSRPLFVGRKPATAPIDFSAPPKVAVATWRPDAGDQPIDDILRELLVRWQPPLNREVRTPWNPDGRPD